MAATVFFATLSMHFFYLAMHEGLIKSNRHARIAKEGQDLVDTVEMFVDGFREDYNVVDINNTNLPLDGR